MSTIELTSLLAAASFIPIFIFGFWLQRKGKPYNGLLFNVHKLIGLAALVFLGYTFFQVNKTAPLQPVEWSVCLVTGLLFIATIITGGLMNIEKSMPAVVKGIHRVFPYLTALAAIASLYLVLF